MCFLIHSTIVICFVSHFTWHSCSMVVLSPPPITTEIHFLRKCFRKAEGVAEYDLTKLCPVFIKTWQFLLGTYNSIAHHDDVIKWKHFPRYRPFVREIHRSPVNFPHKGQWRGALMFSLICARMNGWVNNREAGDLRRYRVHYDVIVMQNEFISFYCKDWCISAVHLKYFSNTLDVSLLLATKYITKLRDMMDFAWIAFPPEWVHQKYSFLILYTAGHGRGVVYILDHKLETFVRLMYHYVLFEISNGLGW